MFAGPVNDDAPSSTDQPEAFVPPDERPVRILFVCLGNICRSPAAENLFRHLAERRGMAGCIAADSAGVMDWHAGKPPDARMAAAALRRGIAMTGKARGFRRDDFRDFDLILTMDRENQAAVLSAAHTDAERNKVRPFAEFVPSEDVAEIPDPYYGGAEGFELVLDLLEAGCEDLLERIAGRRSDAKAS